jgi:signal transduction histidine kinase
VWVEVNAHYLYKGGQRIEIAFRRAEQPPRDSELAPGAPPASDDAPEPEAALAPEAAPETEAAAEVAPEPEDDIEPEAPSAEAAEQAPPYGLVSALAMASLEAAGVAAVALATDGTIASATPETEQALGTPIARLRGRALAELLDLPQPASEALAEARLARRRQTVLADLPDADGQVVIDWIPGLEQGAGVAVLVPSGRDSHDSQAETLRTQARLVSFVAHDVRESLSAVYCGLQHLAEQIEPEAPHRAEVEMALRESERANRIVEDILLVTRPGRRGRVKMDLAAVLAETAERFRERAEKIEVQLTTEFAPDIVVDIDFSSLDRALANLVDNALQATPPGSSLRLASAPDDRGRPGVCIIVADTGYGIQPDILPNIFEPFVTNKPKGTGLGLAFTRRVVLDHAGQIDVESTLGAGTTFTLWLPRAD